MEINRTKKPQLQFKDLEYGALFEYQLTDAVGNVQWTDSVYMKLRNCRKEDGYSVNAVIVHATNSIHQGNRVDLHHNCTVRVMDGYFQET